METNTPAPTNPTPKQNPTMLIGALVVLLLIGGFLFMKNTKKATQNDTMQKEMTVTSAPTAAANTTPATTGEASMKEDTTVKTIEVEAGSFYFKPNTITVKKGQKVKIVLHAVSMMHDFNIDELGVKLPITKNGETNTVEFTADKVGSFEYYCSVGQHRKMGQVGTLTVTE